MAKGEIGERNEMMLLFSVELGILGLQVQGGPLCNCPLRITPHKVLRPNLRLFCFFLCLVPITMCCLVLSLSYSYTYQGSIFDFEKENLFSGGAFIRQNGEVRFWGMFEAVK